MSGGHFDGQQYRLDEIADSIEQLIKDNDVKNEYGESNNYSIRTINKLKKTIKNLRKTAKQVQRVDWLVGGDDSEESFHKRWDEEGC